VKKAFAIAILLIMLMQGIGFYVFYAVQGKLVKIEMRKALKNIPVNKLSVLKLSAKEYQDSRVDEHEVKVNDRMYDIVKLEVHADTVLVYCVHDTKEDKLLALATEIAGKPIRDKHHMLGQIVQFISLAFIPSSFTYTASCVFYKNCVTSLYFFSVQSYLSTVTSPPPRS
jgi:hypothetical protein